MCQATMTTPIYGETYHIAVSVKMTRTIFKCKKCKKVWAREYRKCFKSMGMREFRNYQAPVFSMVRIEGEKVIERGSDYVCPDCGADNSGYQQIFAENVAGTVTEKVCDRKCTGAKGHICECSCGGANHGAAHVIS